MFKDSLSSFSVFIGLLLILATLVLVGASQGALKITFASLQDAHYRDILTFVCPACCWPCWLAARWLPPG